MRPAFRAALAERFRQDVRGRRLARALREARILLRRHANQPARGDNGKTTAEPSVFPSIRRSLLPLREPGTQARKAPARPRLLEIGLASTRDFFRGLRERATRPARCGRSCTGFRYTSASGVRSNLASTVQPKLPPAGHCGSSASPIEALSSRVRRRRLRARWRRRRGPPPEALRGFAEPSIPPMLGPRHDGRFPGGQRPRQRYPSSRPSRPALDPNIRDLVAPIRRREQTTTIDLLRSDRPAPRGLGVDDMGGTA